MILTLPIPGFLLYYCFFLQINLFPNLLSYQEHRDTGTDQIGDCLGSNDTIVTKQGICHNNHGDKHHALPSQGKDGGTLGIAGGLHQAGADHKDRREGHVDQMPAKVFCADRNNGGILHKGADQLRCQNYQHQSHRGGGQDLEGIEEPDNFLYPLAIALSVVVTHQRACAEGEAHDHHGGDHADLGGDACGCQHGAAVQQQEPVGHDLAEGIHQLVCRGRKADGEHRKNLLFLSGQQLGRNAEDLGFIANKVQIYQQRDAVAQNRCDGGTGSAHAESEDENGIQDHIGHTAHGGAQHAGLGHALTAQQVQGNALGDHQRRAQRHPEEILLCKGHGAAVCTQQCQNGCPEGQQRNGGQNAAQHGAVEAEHADPSGPVDLALAEEPGNDTAAAHAEDIAHGQHQGKDWAAEGNTRHQIGIPGCCNKPGVCHVVKQHDHLAQHGGDGQSKVRLGDGGAFKKLLSVGFHGISRLSSAILAKRLAFEYAIWHNEEKEVKKNAGDSE